MSETTSPAPAAGGDAMDAWVRGAQPEAPREAPQEPQDGAEPQPAADAQPEGEAPPEADAAREAEPEAAKAADGLTDEERAERKRLGIEAREARRAARQAAEEAERYRAELDRQRQAAGGQETEEARIERRAAELIAQRQYAERVATFNTRCNEIYDAGVKELGEAFTDAIEDLKSAKALAPSLIEAADEAAGKDAHRVLAYLGAHPEEAKRMASLSPERLGAAVARIADKATERPAVRTRSAAPPPVRGVVGAGTARGEPDPERMSMADFVRWQDKADAERGRY